MSQQYSIKINEETNIIGRAYYKTNRTTLFLAKIVKYVMEENTDPASAYLDFLFHYIDSEFHEELHIFFHNVLKRLPHSENQVKFWCRKTQPFLKELLEDRYRDLFMEIYEWMIEKCHS